MTKFEERAAEVFKRTVTMLAESHGAMMILITSLVKTQLSKDQRAIVAKALEELTRQQAEFSKEFGDFNEPGKN